MSAAAAASSESACVEDYAGLIADFCSLTGLGAPDVNGHAEFAQSFLEGNDWKLEAAVNAYLELKSLEGGGGDNAAAAAAASAGGDGEVRAPLPDKQERLCESTAPI